MRLNTAILIFDEMEVLDFAGPFEVFALTDELAERQYFNVFTVASAPGSVRARNGLKIVPDYTLDTAPKPEVLIVPGGIGTRALLRQPALVEWVNRRAVKSAHTISVCTGALVLAKAGLLGGLDVTTHYQCLDLLRELAPDATVHSDRRFLDNGQILTSAGIAAGIDVSLHVVARLHGAAVAERTAAQMEYRWTNDGGTRR